MISHWSAVQQAKAQALFAKYGLSLEPGEWKSPSDMTVQRVTKPIRMRVRRTCHRCQTTFGPDRVCVNCQHTRCKKCPRYPAPKSKPAEPEQGAVRALPEEKKARDARPVELPRTTQKAELTIPSRSGGQDLVRRPVRQRVKRTCHECESLFPTEDATECINCGHLRCKICPRDPYVQLLLSLMDVVNQVSDPNYANGPTDTQETSNHPSKYPSEPGESLASESATPVTYAPRCIEPENETVPVVARKGVHLRYGIRTYTLL